MDKYRRKFLPVGTGHDHPSRRELPTDALDSLGGRGNTTESERLQATERAKKRGVYLAGIYNNWDTSVFHTAAQDINHSLQEMSVSALLEGFVEECKRLHRMDDASLKLLINEAFSSYIAPPLIDQFWGKQARASTR